MQLRTRSKLCSRNLNDFSKSEIIGTGEFGHVYKCRDLLNNETLAMKRIKLERGKQGFPSNLIREISALRELTHQNIVKLKYVLLDENWIYLYFQYVSNNLRSYITSLKKDMEPQKFKMFLYHILEGVAECHSKNILHRDLKTENILINQQGDLKIADFGLARKFQSPTRPYTEEVVTMWYRAPELLLGLSDYSTSVDMWSIGCVFAEMVTSKVFFRGTDQTDQLYRIFKTLGTPTEKRWPGISKLRLYNTNYPNWPENTLHNCMSEFDLDNNGIDLMEKLLEYDPKVRISAKQALNHPYFSDFKK